MDKVKAELIRTKRQELVERNSVFADADARPEEVWIEEWANGECLKVELYINGKKEEDPGQRVDELLRANPRIEPPEDPSKELVDKP